MFTLLNSRSDGGSRTRGLVAAAAAALVVSPLAAIAPASANPLGTGLVISEAYGGGGNSGATLRNDFIELFNPTNAAISVEEMSVQYRSGTGTGTGFTNLTGSVPAQGHYLIQQAAGAGGTDNLPTPDATGTLNMSGTSGSVALVTGAGTITPDAANTIDLVGFGVASLREGSAAPAPSNTTSVSRNAARADSDDNAFDFTTGAPNPQNSGPTTPTALEATSPGAKSGQVDSPVAGFTLAATGGTSPYTWTATGLPAGVTVAANGAVSGTPTTDGAYTVTATATDSATTPATDDMTFTYTISASATLRPIAEIQGTGPTSPLAGQNVKTRGVVTASYPTGGLNGFYLQTPGADTANASDAVFVYGGTSGFTTYPAVGDSVEVTGQAAEFSGATQIAASQSGVVEVSDLGTVTPKTQIPGTDCALPGTACLAGTALNDAREVAEGELFQPTAPWTATDVYDGSPFYQGTAVSGAFRGEIGVAADSDDPLVSPTEVIDAQATAQIADRTKYNNAHRIVMDDGSSLTYSTSQNSGSPFPWFTADHTVRVGAEITFPKPVIFTEGFSTWRILPLSQIVGAPTGQINVEQTRPAAPENVGGDVKLATFNVLNFFPTTGEEFVSSGLGTCTYYNDRAGAKVTVNSCTNNGPRGAANDANLVRQRDKIVAAINTVDADIVSLEELENSVQFGKDRDFAINELVSALNADAGAGTWAAVPSPAASELPPLSEQDVIRNGFLYQPGNVALVGASDVLADQSSGTEAFADAREPVAQAFKQVGTPDADAFAVIVNHFKSKGSGTPDPDGQGNANDRRILQANALVTFADEFKKARGITRVFLAGDFNSYSEEDPIQVLNAAGYANLDSSSNPDEESYNFDGMVGSLDHVLANPAALGDVNAVDMWEINANESVYYEYGRFNTNVTNLYAPNAFRSSDHNPEIVGLNTRVAPIKVDATITATVSPESIQAQTGTATIKVEVASTNGTPTGAVAALVDGRVVGGGELVDGRADVLVGPFQDAGTKAITVKFYGDALTKAGQIGLSLIVTPAPVVEKATPVITASVDPATLKVKKDTSTVAVTVASAGGPPTGTVLALVDNKVVGAGDLVAGKASIVIGPFDTVGAKAITLKYLGDDTTLAGTGNASVMVQKATPKLSVKAPKKFRKGEKVEIKATTSADGFVPTGQVRASIKGKSVTATLSGGVATLKLGKLRPGTYTVTVTYLGSDIADTVTESVRVTVKKDKGKKKD